AECTISTSVWGSNIEFTNNQNALLSSFLTYHNADELQDIISSCAERLMEEDVPEFIKASLDDFYFFDCDGDGEEEMLTVLELHDINNGFLNSCAVYYVDNSEVSFISDGVHRHRSVFFAAVDSQPFVIFAEIPGMGYSVDPVIEAEKAFTFSNGGFVPYDPPERKSLCVRVGGNGSRLYLFNTDVNKDTEYYYMDEIASGDVEQTLGWVNGELKVIDGFEAE
ncbi:MAG: hypothetical protein K2J11_02160, partial [Oscillospiraceae bacterium]|nr:hypothetical protein [Oscillospiraceae bacterium]